MDSDPEFERERERDGCFELEYLSRLDLEVDSGDPFEMLLEESLRVVLPDLLPRHWDLEISDWRDRESS